jgi:uncharacterized protein YbaP (TraB family)
MSKSLISTCLSVFICLSSLFAQQLPKTLLWRITGKGLGKPSYLYGTMHVYDPRLFDLGDSLLYAISSSDGFANELDLTRITPMLVDFLNQEINHSLTLKEILSSKSYDKYGPALSKKLNKPADEITGFDILREKNKWIDEGYKGKKMQTFLDAYLSDLAYRQGKWIGGVEDFSDQSGLLNAGIDESDIRQLVLGDGSSEKAEMESMVNTYQNSDLDGFQKMVTSMDSSSRDMMLIKRNRKMAFRMDSLAHQRTMVFAVGAAHLPGNEGLISLLRKKGYSVDPVFYSKRIKPKDYTVPEVIRPWVEVNDPDGHYKVMMPGTPGDLKFYGIMTMAMYFNIFNGTWYLTASASLPYDQKGLDSVERAMLKQLFGSRNYKEESNLVVNGVPGKSYVQKNAEGFKKAYFLYKDNILYYAVGFSASDTITSLNSVDKFFKSFQPIPAIKDMQAGHFEWVDSVRAYQILLPAKPKPIDGMTKSTNTTVRSDLLISTDPQTGTYYFIGSTEAVKGYTLQNDSSTIRSVHDNLLEKFQDITRDTTYVLNDHRMLDMDGSMVNGSMRAKMKVISRGNRYYTLLIMYGPGKWNETADIVMSSFQLRKYAFNKWENKTSPDSLFSTWVPDRILYKKDKEDSKEKHTLSYESYDSSRADTYSIKLDTLGKYFWTKNDSSLWKEQKDRFTDVSDTVLSERIFTKDGLTTYEFFKKPRGANNMQRIRMILWGNSVCRLSSTQESGTIREENVNRYFDQFKFHPSPPETEIFKSKAGVLLKDLQSLDSNTRKQAFNALTHAPFIKDEIRLLREAVLISYPSDSGQNKSVNRVIAEHIIELDDSSSVQFASSHLSSASQQENQNALLEIISAYQTKSNYEALGKLLLSSTPNSKFPYAVTKKWYDSLQLAAVLFPTVLPLLKDSAKISSILDIASDLLDSNLISITIFKPWQETILNYADKRFKITRADTLNYTSTDYSVINYLKRFNNEPSNAMLKKWLQVVGNGYHKQAIVLALLENMQPIDQQTLTYLAASKYNRIDLYKNLRKYKNSALFPMKYRTQSFFAESLVADAASAFSDDDADISFIEARDMKYKGKMFRFFFYNVFISDEEEHWLAVAGPYNMDRTDISLSEARGEVYSKEQYETSKSVIQMKALISQMEKPANKTD